METNRAAGAGAQTASLLMIIAFALPVWGVFYRMAQIEEADMTARFGDMYRDYQARTWRFWPNPLLWTRSSGEAFDFHMFARTLRDSSIFALAPIVVVTLRWAHDAHLLPVLYRTP